MDKFFENIFLRSLSLQDAFIIIAIRSNFKERYCLFFVFSLFYCKKHKISGGSFIVKQRRGLTPPGAVQSVKEDSIKSSRNSIFDATVEKAGKKA